MSKYEPVMIKALQWNRVLKHIREKPKGLAVYELAETLKVEKGDFPLELALKYLLKQGRIKFSIGSYDGMVCRFVTAVGATLPDEDPGEQGEDVPEPKGRDLR